MAKKRARKPIKPAEVLEIQSLPEPLIVAEEEGSSDDAIRDLLGFPTDTTESSSPAPPEVSKEIPPGTLDRYLQSQVLQEMYGTDNPTDYDKLSLALKRRL